MFGSVVEAVMHFAEQLCNKTAIVTDNSEITYNDLKQGILSYASQLSERGIKNGDKVILASNHTVQFVEMYCAVHWLGAVNVVVEKKASIKSLSQLIESISPKLIILNQAEIGADCYDSFTVSDFTITKGNYEPGSLADILFTTGTTGMPKGVMLSHRNEVAGALNVITGGEMSQQDINLLTMPLHHAFGLTTLRAVLYNGGTVVLQDGVASVKKINENIHVHSCNTIYMVPAALRVLYFQTRQRLDLLLGDIEKIEFCTAPLDKKMRLVLSEQLKGTRLYNSYGATESARTVYMRLDKNPEKITAIGRAVENVSIWIVDDDRRKIDSSKTHFGHLAIRGNMNMMGYYNDPKTTQSVLSKGIFYSEDLGYMDKDGYIYLIGRNNDVINTGGEKVSPLEIENTALEYIGVRECACIGVEDMRGILGYIPVLYITEETGHTVDVGNLKKYLEGHLEHYKVPHEIIVIDEIPKNQIGKIDRGSLKKLWEVNTEDKGECS